MKKLHIKKLDTLWSQKVRQLGCCCVCSRWGRLNAHHYVGRANRGVRWYIPNGFCLCVNCHTYGIRSAHQDPEWFREKALEMRGKEWLDDLVEKSRIDCMASKQEYEVELAKLKEAE